MTAKRTTPGARPAGKTTSKRLSLRKKTLKDLTPSGTGPGGARRLQGPYSTVPTCNGTC